MTLIKENEANALSDRKYFNKNRFEKMSKKKLMTSTQSVDWKYQQKQTINIFHTRDLFYLIFVVGSISLLFSSVFNTK